MHHFGTAKARVVRRVHMSRAEFIGLVAGWGGGLVLLSFLETVARYLG